MQVGPEGSFLRMMLGPAGRRAVGFVGTGATFKENYVNKNTLLVGLLVVAIVVVVYLWMNDRESQDLSIDIGHVDVPALTLPA